MKIIYIAGPFRAPNAWEIEQNIRRAETLALEIWRMGAAVICPHANTRFFQGAADDEVWLEGDLEILRRCDAVVMTKDWEKSQGAKAEHAFAEKEGVPIFNEEKLWHLEAWLRGKSRTDGPIENRFWEKVDKRRPHECWPWMGSRQEHGHGLMRSDGSRKLIKTHRVSWEIHNGPIPSGLFVCHKCDNPPCVNPRHLFLGTAADNAHDRDSKGRTAKGERNGRAKLSEADVLDIRKKGRPGKYAELARKYGVDLKTIKSAATGKSWRHI